jgi:hypothetical protein
LPRVRIGDMPRAFGSVADLSDPYQLMRLIASMKRRIGSIRHDANTVSAAA